MKPLLFAFEVVRSRITTLACKKFTAALSEIWNTACNKNARQSCIYVYSCLVQWFIVSNSFSTSGNRRRRPKFNRQLLAVETIDLCIAHGGDKCCQLEVCERLLQLEVCELLMVEASVANAKVVISLFERFWLLQGSWCRGAHRTGILWLVKVVLELWRQLQEKDVVGCRVFEFIEQGASFFYLCVSYTRNLPCELLLLLLTCWVKQNVSIILPAL